MAEIDWNQHLPKDKNVAMLIDGDNAQPPLMDAMIDEAMKFGHMTFRRVYGDWTSQNMNGWKSLLQEHAFQPIQQFRNTVGKNATDSALIIDAMDILHREDVDIFVIVSSDADFTRLATRLREDAKMVVGIGERKTPTAFVKACNIFVYTENLVLFGGDQASDPSIHVSPGSQGHIMDREELRCLLMKAIEQTACEDGSCLLSQIGISLHKIDPGFDPRTFGKKKLLDLIAEYPEDFGFSKSETGGPMTIWIINRDSC